MTEPEFRQEFVDRDADRIGVQLYPLPDDPAAPVVVVWPAMGVPARYYRRFAGQLRAAGLGVAVADLRGTGASTPAPSGASRYGLADLTDDVGAVLHALKPWLDGRSVLLLGHSLGGQACALYLATQEETLVDGLVLVAVGLPYWRRYPGRRGLGVLAFTQSIAGVSALLRVWPGWGFGGRQARGVIRDWGYTARHGRYPHLAGVDADAALARLGTPVLAVSVEHDRFTPASTVDHLVAKLSSAQVARIHLAAAEDGAPLDHFSWIRSRTSIAARVAEFARAHQRPGPTRSGGSAGRANP